MASAAGAVLSAIAPLASAAASFKRAAVPSLTSRSKLARLKTRQKASDTRRKIIVGAIVTTEALKDPKIARWLASTLRKNATRDVDQKEIAGLLADLDARAQSAGAGEA